ncbi:MAG: hypothetical protein ACR2MY_12910 [Candidatus Dormibacteria bacterium]
MADEAQRQEARRLLALATAATTPQTQRLLIAAAIGAVFERPPVIVGGTAEEHWLSEESRPTDIDLCPRPSARDLLELSGLGFSREGRHWVHPDLIHGVEFPGTGDDIHRTVEVEVGGSRVRVIGLDDLYLDRLRQATASETARFSQRLDSLIAMSAIWGTNLDGEYITGEIKVIQRIEPQVGLAMEVMQRRVAREVRHRLAERRAGELRRPGPG